MTGVVVMLHGFAGWLSTGIVSVPVWAVVAGLAVIIGALALRRATFDGTRMPLLQGALIVAAVVAGWWALDYVKRRNVAVEQRNVALEQQAIEARMLDLATRALAPGSALACLDAIAGDAVENACEKALFASPEATAAAVSYVAAQLSLLAWANDPARPASTSSSISQLRRAIEADRFGMVAHVLAERDGCTPSRCAALALLRDAGGVSANLAERPFEAFVKRYAASWPAAGSRPVASNPPPVATATAPGSPPKSPNSLYFPSSSSIPPVNIMTAEPAAPPPHDTTGTAAAPTPPRKPAAAPPPRQPTNPNAAPARTAPMPLAPGQ
jgi:hypothetical protein